jgi:outer membrane lipoprotein-sorting protein
MKNLFIGMMLILAGQVSGQLSANEIVKKVNARFEGNQLTQKVNIKMVDKRGKTQERSLTWFRKDYKDQRKSVILYQAPANVKGTSFLTYDYHTQSKEDDQWLYLPALRRTRRISAANRGDYFLGTDLTYEDIKLATKIGANDYTFSAKGNQSMEGRTILVVEGIPKNAKIAKELGYSKVIYLIDSEIFMPRRITYWDIAGNKLKEVNFNEIKKVQGIYTMHGIEAQNFKTSHTTSFRFNDPDYETSLGDDLFSEEAMIRGI